MRPRPEANTKPSEEELVDEATVVAWVKSQREEVDE